MSRLHRIDYHQVDGLPLIPGYYLREKRKELNLTLNSIENEVGIEGSYLNKMENGACDVPEPTLRSLIRFYSINWDRCFECTFDRAYVDDCFDAICHSTFSDEDYRKLEVLIKRHEGSFYKIYLKIIQFGYLGFKQNLDDEFKKEIRYFIKSSAVLDQQCQSFIFVFALLVGARSIDHAILDEVKKISNSAGAGKWKIIELYARILLINGQNDKTHLTFLLEECRRELEKFPNEKINNAILYLRACQYADLKDYAEAIRLFEEYCQICLGKNDLDNYGIGLNGIAGSYSEMKDYIKAIEYYELAKPFMGCFPDFYFDIAWCYYCIGDANSCLKEIKIGKKISNEVNQTTLYLEWLENMVNNPYCKRAKQKLIRIYKDFYDDLPVSMQTFHLIALMNQAKHDGDFGAYIEYSQKLLALNVNSNIEIK